MNNFRSLAVWIVIALLLFALFSLFQGQTQRLSSSDVSYSEFLSKVDSGEVKSVTISGDSISGQYTNGTGFQTYAPQDSGLVATLRQKGVEIKARPAGSDEFLPSLIFSWLSLIHI